LSARCIPHLARQLRRPAALKHILRWPGGECVAQRAGRETARVSWDDLAIHVHAVYM
jgi:hypothetical protein